MLSLGKAEHWLAEVSSSSPRIITRDRGRIWPFSEASRYWEIGDTFLWDLLHLFRSVCVCVSFSTFQVFYRQFEFSWQNPQVFSGTDAWRRGMLVLKQSNAQSWGSSCSTLVTVYTTSLKGFRKQIILEPIPPIQNSGPFSSAHTCFPRLFVWYHEF